MKYIQFVPPEDFDITIRVCAAIERKENQEIDTLALFRLGAEGRYTIRLACLKQEHSWERPGGSHQSGPVSERVKGMVKDLSQIGKDL